MIQDRRFDELYESSAQAVYAYFAAHFGKVLAEDLTQETFLKVLRYLRRYETFFPQKPHAWIFRIALSAKNDFLRQKQRRPTHTEWEQADMAAARGETESESSWEQSLAIRQALAKLKESQREILLLAGQGFSSGELGELLDIPASTARSRLSAARHRFAEYLKEEGGLLDDN